MLGKLTKLKHYTTEDFISEVKMFEDRLVKVNVKANKGFIIGLKNFLAMEITSLPLR